MLLVDLKILGTPSIQILSGRTSGLSESEQLTHRNAKRPIEGFVRKPMFCICDFDENQVSEIKPVVHVQTFG